jgi:hypothetical protein
VQLQDAAPRSLRNKPASVAIYAMHPKRNVGAERHDDSVRDEQFY